MTGYMVRVVRHGVGLSVDIDELTDDELEHLSRLDPGAGWVWAIALAKWIRNHVREVNQRGEEG